VDTAYERFLTYCADAVVTLGRSRSGSPASNWQPQLRPLTYRRTWANPWKSNTCATQPWSGRSIAIGANRRSTFRVSSLSALRAACH